MELTAGQTAKQSGVSVRTLHYYDQIGLLSPSRISESGYRYYGDSALRRLQSILFFRELDFSLAQIASILDGAPDMDTILEDQRRMLLLKRERLDGLIGLIDKMRRGEDEMSFREFGQSELDSYRKEAKERWGKTDAWRQSEARAKGYSKEDYAKIQAEAEQIFRAFAELTGEDAAGAAVQELTERWRAHICRYFYDCPVELFSSLGHMYVEDLRFSNYLDGFSAGTAQLMSEAIAVYCDEHQ